MTAFSFIEPSPNLCIPTTSKSLFKTGAPLLPAWVSHFYENL